MTAINVIKQKSAVHMLTDGASWHPSGEFGPPCVKAWPLPHLNCVVSARGPRCAPALVADYIGSAASSYDDLRSRAVGIIRDAVNFYQNVFALNERFGGRAEFVIAGWSSFSGAAAFVVVADDQNRGIDAWQVHDCGPVMMAPGDLAIESAVRDSLPSNVTSADTMDPERDGLTMLQAQRRARNLSNDALGTIVGAFAHLTSVTPAGITTRIIHRWNED